MSFLNFKPIIPVATAAILLGSGLGQGAYAENKLGSVSNAGELLKLSQTEQEGIISVAITTVGTVASQIQPEISKCLDEWYTLDDKIRRKRRFQIIDVMKKFPEHTPTIIVFSVVEKVCGKFKRNT